MKRSMGARGAVISSLVCFLLPVLSPAEVGNVLQNFGFESEGAKGVESARAWDDNVVGGWWGAAFRTDWKAHQGQYAAGVKGSYSGMDYGGWWQAADVVAGHAYAVSAKFFWDNEWSAETQKLKIEWYQAGKVIDASEVDLRRLPGGVWTSAGLEAKAPAGADKAHIVLEVAKSANSGCFYMDEVVFRESSPASE